MTDNKKKISVILGCMCILLSYGIAAQIKTTNTTGTTVSTNSIENELRSEVLKSKEKYDNLYEELENLENELERERTSATQNNGELEELENSIKEANKALGLTEVQGQGVTIILDDNKKMTLNNYIGDPNNLIVHYDDVLMVVNELKNSGAEAISVNGQRIVTTTSIQCDGNVIKINGQKVGAPFEIKAIGLPERFAGALDRYGGYLMTLRENYGLEATLTREENVIIPKYTGVIKFNYAESK